MLLMQPVKPLFSPLLLGISMMMAPFLFGLSTFFWKEGEYGTTGGAILVSSLTFWVPAFAGLFSLLQDKMPRYTAVGFVVAVWGCISGANFGMAGVFMQAFGISHDTYLQAVAQHAFVFGLLLFWSGPLFPLSLLVLSIALLGKKCIPLWAGILMGLGALAFPLSRIPRIETIAHMADLLLALPVWYVGWQYLQLAAQSGTHRIRKIEQPSAQQP